MSIHSRARPTIASLLVYIDIEVDNYISSDLKKTFFYSKCSYLASYEQNNKIYSKSDLKNAVLTQNVDIYRIKRK